MKVIISPAKTMRDKEDGFEWEQLPTFCDEAGKLLEELKKYNVEELMKLMKCNRKIAELNFERFKIMNLEESLIPALFAYDGLQFKSMVPHVFSEQEYAWVKQHLIILSGFYGCLKPNDGVRFYRLEMQTELKVGNDNNLYDFWNDKLYHEVYKENELCINLASKEYSQGIEKYLKKENKMITCVFGEWNQGKVKVKGTLAKMARGAMVRFMAENQVTTWEELKLFCDQGFHYHEELSSDVEMVFIKE